MTAKEFRDESQGRFPRSGIGRCLQPCVEFVAVTAAALALPIDVVAGAAFLIALIWFGQVVE